MNQYKNVRTYQIGLSDKYEILSFDTASGIATRIDELGSEQLTCNSLDCILKNEKVDLIKMDIEGAEYNALLGAKDIIKTQKPVLAICVYHKPEDFYAIPILIKQLCPDYRLYFRQYELSDTETICYAV